MFTRISEIESSRVYPQKDGLYFGNLHSDLQKVIKTGLFLPEFC